MSEVEYFGDTFAEYSFGQAIKDKNLSDYKVVVVGVNDKQLKNDISNRELVKIKSLIAPSKYIKHDMEYISILSALHKSIKKYILRRINRDLSTIDDVKSFLIADIESKKQLLSNNLNEIGKLQSRMNEIVDLEIKEKEKKKMNLLKLRMYGVVMDIRAI